MPELPDDRRDVPDSPDDEQVDDDLDVEDVLEDAADLFQADHEGSPAADADAPPPG